MAEEAMSTELVRDHDRLTDELSSRGASWVDVESDDDQQGREYWTLGEYAVLHVERDTNATICDRVGDVDEGPNNEPPQYAHERDAYLAAIALNERRLEEDERDPQAAVWVPDWIEGVSDD